MLTYSNQQGGALTALAQQPLVIPGGANNQNLAYIHYRPTAMDLITGTTPNYYIRDAVRGLQTVYMKGFSEHVRIETNTGNPWFHRRICFTSRDPTFLTAANSDPSGTERSQVASGSIETSDGRQRLAANMLADTLPQTYLNHKSVIFKGAEGVDWDDIISAPIDTTRIDLKFDKTWVYKSGNERGILREHKLYHPMNKNLVFDDDESGATMATADYSVTDKRGMGNYFVTDIFSQGASGATTDRLSIRFNSTLYWHEK